MNHSSSQLAFQGFTIRSFLEQDRQIILQYWCELDLHVMAKLADASRYKKISRYPEYVHQCLSQYQHNPDSLILVGEQQGLVSGFIVAHKQTTKMYQEKNTGLIGVCFVHPLYRRRGLARQLVLEVQNWFRQEQINYIDVVWDQGNPAAEQFWQALGFIPSQIRAHLKLNK